MFRYQLLLLFTLLCTCARAQENNAVTLLDESLVAPDGLYFAGDQGTDYQFGRQISAHGDCVEVINGFVFVTWYQGGMDKRFLRLSRRRIDDPDAPWITLEFPDQHVGYRGDPTIGDSHNTASVGVSTIDSTVHLLYDMHAYSQSSYPDNFFNYRVSEPGAAFVPDAEFTLERFAGKRNYLKQGENYERATYPAFNRMDNGQLVVRYRLGGAGNGDILFSVFGEDGWRAPYTFTDGTIPLPHRYSEYGSEIATNGKLYAGFSIRYGDDARYALNSGFYYAEATGPFGPNDWGDVAGNPVSTPIGIPDALLIGAPEDDYGTAAAPRTSTSPAFTVTDAGAVHFVGWPDNRNVHYWRAVGDTTFSSAAGGDIPGPGGSIFAFGEDIVMMDLANGYPVVKRTPAGTNDWETIYSNNQARRFHHFRAVLSGNKLYAYLQERDSGKARPLYLQTYDLGRPTSTANTPAWGRDLVLYPNPATDLVHLFNAPVAARYTLYAVDGKVAASGKLTGNSFRTGHLTRGTYFCRVTNREGAVVRKIILR